MTSVRRGFATAGNAYSHMPAHVRCAILSASNVREVYGTTGAASFSAPFATAAFAKMISLSTRLPVRCLKLKAINVC